MSSPVLCAAGTAQVGEGLVNSWGLEEEEEEEESQMTEDRKRGSTFC